MIINELTEKIIKLNNVAPSTYNNKLFSDLIIYSQMPINRAHSLSRAKLNLLHNKLALAEYEMEKYWANQISSNLNPKSELKNFIYYNNYLDLTKLELANIYAFASPKKILFIGSGPLPLTSIITKDLYKDVTITLIDYNEEACELSQRLLESLDIKDVNIINTDILNFDNVSEFDLIILGAMVGQSSKAKLKIIDHIAGQMKKDAVILIRNVFGVRTILYRNITTIKHKLLQLILEVRPHNHIINSFFILQKT